MMNGKKKATNEEKRIEYTVTEMRISVLMDIPLKKSREQLLFKLTNMTINFLRTEILLFDYSHERTNSAK